MQCAIPVSPQTHAKWEPLLTASIGAYTAKLEPVTCSRLVGGDLHQTIIGSVVSFCEAGDAGSGRRRWLSRQPGSVGVRNTTGPSRDLKASRPVASGAGELTF